MSNLYNSNMAIIYDAMYQTFIDYDQEYEFYNTFIQENNAMTTLEIGSGTGNLAKRFMAKKQNYIGLDYSEDMIKIALERNPNGQFIQGDMRNFNLDKKIDSIIITGRTTSYLITNQDFSATLKSVFSNLNDNGVLIFDFIDANRFIPFTKKNPVIIHEATYQGIHYLRESSWGTTQSENFMLEWTAKYFTLKDNEKEKMADDFSTVRVFTLNEIELFLSLNGFEILKIIDRKTYAYDTFVIVAKKRDLML